MLHFPYFLLLLLGLFLGCQQQPAPKQSKPTEASENPLAPDTSLASQLLNEAIKINNTGANDTTAFFDAERAKALFASALGANDKRVADALLQMGRNRYNAKEYDAALRIYKQSLSMYHHLFGKIHQDVAECYRNMGNCYGGKSNFDSAIVLCKRSSFILEKLHGNNSPDIASARLCLSIWTRREGNIDEALKYLDSIKVFAFEKVSDKLKADTYQQYGRYYEEKDNLDKAKDYYQKSLSIKKEKH